MPRKSGANAPAGRSGRGIVCRRSGLAGELAVNQNTILRVYERLTAEGLFERRHGDGTFVADRVPSGQMKAQRQLLRQQIARTGELAKTLGIDAAELHELLDESWERTDAERS